MQKFDQYITLFVYAFGVFSIALIVRMNAPGQFLTADEFLWIDRSKNFVAGLTNPDYTCTTRVEGWESAQGWACTLRTGHPGVTTMWSGALGITLRWLWDAPPMSLHDYAVSLETNPVERELVPWTRYGVILTTFLAIGLATALIYKLFNTFTAFLAGLLMALNSFYIALSGVIHHDALSTSFMMLATLCALIYWREHQLASFWQWHKIWLFLSGVCAGLAFLSKLPALFLGVMVALIGFVWVMLWPLWEEEDKPLTKTLGVLKKPRVWGELIADGLLWFGTSCLVVVACWPAMWVIPWETLEVVFFIGSKYSSDGHAKGSFLFGEVASDPGLWFYPTTWFYRTSPVVLIGLVGLVGWFVRPEGFWKPFGSDKLSVPKPVRSKHQVIYVLLLICFIAGYLLMMTMVAKKQERYLLPIYPWFDLLAGIGLIWLIQMVQQRSKLLAISAGTVLLLSLLFTSFIHQPYYFTAYNPIAQLFVPAEEAITMGWGEGMELAADYLNAQGEPYPRVTSWYASTFAPYYRGETVSYSKEKGKALHGEMVTFYINQRQRGFPDRQFFEFYEQRFEPIKVIHLHGKPHVWIYPSLGIDHYVEDQTYTGIASLLAWQWADDLDRLEFELYWEYLGKNADEPFFVRIVDAQNRLVAETITRPDRPVRSAENGQIIAETGTLFLPWATPPGLYQIEIGVYTKAEAVTSGELLFELPEEQRIIRIEQTFRRSGLDQALGGPAVEIEPQSLGERVYLRGYSLPTTPITSTLSIELYWQSRDTISADQTMHIGLTTATGDVVQAWFDLSLAETISPTMTLWEPGTMLHTRWQLELLPEVSTNDYQLQVVLPEDTDQQYIFGKILVP